MARALQDILETMPDAGWQRFSAAFWAAKANFVLNEIETTLSGPYLNIEVAIPLVDGVTMYTVPSNIRKVQRIRLPSGTYLGITERDPKTKVRYELLGKQFRLECAITLSGLTDNFLTAISPASTYVISGTIIDWPDQTGRAAVITHADGSSETLIIASNFVDGSGHVGVNLNGSLKKPIQDGETCNITSNFLLMEGRARLDKFVDFTTLSPLPDEWDRCLAKGLRFYLEAQQDESMSGVAKQWYDLFQADIEQMGGDYNEFDGDNYPIQPRAPGMWSGVNRNDDRAILHNQPYGWTQF